jgi:UDP-N-acetylmuramoyl-tripeptide--D-alanyl-D-alanine ligase
MEVRESDEGWTIVNDSYNANPDSMRAALQALAAMGAARRSWAVLGEMRELGEISDAQHEAVGILASNLRIDRLVCVGEGARGMASACSADGATLTRATWVATPEDAISMLRSELTRGDVVLVKASRSIGLERIAEALLAKGRS